ncbi:hypothetical protein M514_23167 [Trichuris suis]|uniref:Uncharacterized protein n=1 Tax=Trichuris suis TaxID=68888 RepID=A0A085N5G3_9BILA|nr:hypothetical protein M514_23167 [Trichuris suis]
MELAGTPLRQNHLQLMSEAAAGRVPFVWNRGGEPPARETIPSGPRDHCVPPAEATAGVHEIR